MSSLAADPSALLAVVIGASAGAVQALLRILPQLPPDFPLPIIVVVHIPPDRSNALVSLFQSRCQMSVKEAEDKEPIVASTVYFAPSDYHILVEAGHTLALSNDEPVNHSRPAIDILFESAADAYGKSLAAIVMTGANEDGAAGFKAAGESGAVTIVQNPELAQVPTMPAAALAAWPQAQIMSLEQIVAFLQGIIRS